MRHRSRAGAILIAAVALAGATTPPASRSLSPIADLTVAVEGLRSQRGQVLVCLTTSARAFPDCSRDPHARRMAVPAPAAGAIVFAGVPAGHYAVSLLHDENGNGKADMALIIPREGFGFSRNPVVRFGPPAFARAAFAVGPENQRQAIRMRYMF